MLGDKIGEESGKVISQRVLPNPGGAPKMETTFRMTGAILGIGHNTTDTYTSMMRQDGTLFGEGQAVVIGKNGEMATWCGQGVGTIKKNGSVSYRGAIYFQTTASKWVRLNGIAMVFEYEVDPEGNTKSESWEWK